MSTMCLWWNDYVVNTLIINVLHASSRGGVYPHPTSCGQDTKQSQRSCEGVDRPHPYAWLSAARTFVLEVYRVYLRLQAWGEGEETMGTDHCKHDPVLFAFLNKRMRFHALVLTYMNLYYALIPLKIPSWVIEDIFVGHWRCLRGPLKICSLGI